MNYYVYILTNANKTVLYIGVTNNLDRRIQEHKCGSVYGFTKRYKLNKLVYLEQTDNILDAIEREKILKKWNRKKKEKLISLKNPSWDDLY